MTTAPKDPSEGPITLVWQSGQEWRAFNVLPQDMPAGPEIAGFAVGTGPGPQSAMAQLLRDLGSPSYLAWRRGLRSKIALLAVLALFAGCLLVQGVLQGLVYAAASGGLVFSYVVQGLLGAVHQYRVTTHDHGGQPRSFV